MDVITKWEQVEALRTAGSLTDAEEKLIKACETGAFCDVGDRFPVLPAQKSKIVHAELLRYLILGGCKSFRTHEKGINLMGAVVKGHLSLDHSKARGRTYMRNCNFEEPISARQGDFQALSLSGSAFASFNAENSKSAGDMFFNKVESRGEILLSGIATGADINFRGAQIHSKTLYSLVIQTANIGGALFLHPTTKEQKEEETRHFFAEGIVAISNSKMRGFYAEGVAIQAAPGEDAIRATNVEILGNCRLEMSHLGGELRFSGAKVTGSFFCDGATMQVTKGHAFNGKGMKVEQSFVWKDVKVPDPGKVNLSGAHVAELDDDPDGWPPEERLLLDGFTYDRIKGKVATSKARQKWLEDGSYFDGEFRPQPYTQYAKFLRDTGHDEDARAILYERERLRRKSMRWEQLQKTPFLADMGTIWDSTLRVLVGYGHRPFRSMAWLFGFWLLAVVLAHMAWENGDFAPASGPLLATPEWQEIAASDAANPAKDWSSRMKDNGKVSDYEFGQDWSTFSRFAYAADLVIPIINLGQTDTWSPSTERGDWGRRLWRYGFFLQIAGWIVTALGAAAITGLIRRE